MYLPILHVPIKYRHYKINNNIIKMNKYPYRHFEQFYLLSPYDYIICIISTAVKVLV